MPNRNINRRGPANGVRIVGGPGFDGVRTNRDVAPNQTVGRVSIHAQQLFTGKEIHFLDLTIAVAGLSGDPNVGRSVIDSLVRWRGELDSGRHVSNDIVIIDAHRGSILVPY